MENEAVLGVDESEDVTALPYRYLTRHGLIAGTTGTGKSRAMQMLAEQLADAGMDVFVSDVKGDASGFCVEGQENERNKLAPFGPHRIKANYWSVGDRFASLRFSVSGIGPVLLARLLFLNPTQESHLALAFSYAKERKPLDDLDQLLDVLDEMVKTNQRGTSGSSISVIERKIIALQESGAGRLFGRPSIRLEDLHGLNVLNLSDSRKNMVVSIAPAFLLQMLFDALPEVGDVKKPKHAIFFDEAHYLFKDANKSLRNLMVTILKQIRSKGVSVFFVTQDVTDLPDEVLSQLSTKIIFSQKVFTQKGNQRLRALAGSFPKSDTDVMEKLKTMPPGVAIVSTLDGKGNQTEPKEVRIFAPATSMEVVPDGTIIASTDRSLMGKYRKKIVAKKQGKTPPEILQRKESAIVQKQEKEKPKKKGPSVWDAIFGFLLRLLDFILKAAGKILSFVIFKPAKKFFRWLVKKPIRILWFLIFLLILYVIIVNWHVIQGFLDMLKL